MENKHLLTIITRITSDLCILQHFKQEGIVKWKNSISSPVRYPFHSNYWQFHPCMSNWQRNRQCHQGQQPPSPVKAFHNSSPHQDHYAYRILYLLEVGHWNRMANSNQHGEINFEWNSYRMNIKHQIAQKWNL